MKKITSLAELKELGRVECFIALSGGARSSKTIEWDGKKFYVFHDIVGEWDSYTPEELEDSNIGRALIAGNLIRY